MTDAPIGPAAVREASAVCHVGTRGALHGKEDLTDDKRFGFGIVSSAELLRQGVDEVVGLPAALRLPRHRRAGRRRHGGGGVARRVRLRQLLALS